MTWLYEVSKFICHGIKCHIMIQLFFFFFFHFFPRSWSRWFYLSQHTMTKLHAMIFFPPILLKTNFEIILHDVHVCTLHLYSAWHLKATPSVELKYSSHTTCNPKNLAYLCSTSHAEQSYATCLSKSFFLVEILLIEIDDFRPNLAGVAHIWPQGLIRSLRVRAK
jgi:hypothetical protein